jgi:exoribonuclease II
MYALYEDAGRFQAGRVMSEADTSLQVELDSGKRVKVKTAAVMLRFDKPGPAEFMAQAAEVATSIDLDLAWEFAPEGDFSFGDLAREYFDAKAGLAQQAAALLRLFEAPHYFRRLGKGLFKKAPEEIVKAALLGIERKRQQALQIEAWAEELAAGHCPAPVREQLYRILFKPDKNGAEYKAVVEATKRAQRAPLDLLKAAGAIDSPYQFHWRRFLFETFPQGTGFPALAAPAVKENLPLATVQARLWHPHCRASLGLCPRLADRQSGARAHVHGLHAGLENHHAARRRGPDLYPDCRARLPGGEPVRHPGRSHA